LKGVLGVNAQAVIQKNDKAWSAFFELPKYKNQGGYHLISGRLHHQGIGRIGLPMRKRYIYLLEVIDTT
jgi:hypothetical protein